MTILAFRIVLAGAHHRPFGKSSDIPALDWPLDWRVHEVIFQVISCSAIHGACFVLGCVSNLQKHIVISARSCDETVQDIDWHYNSISWFEVITMTIIDHHVQVHKDIMTFVDHMLRFMAILIDIMGPSC